MHQKNIIPLLLMILFSWSHLGFSRNHYQLKKDERKILSFKSDLRRVTSSQPGIVDLTVSNNKRLLTITAQKKGETRVTIELRRGKKIFKYVTVDDNTLNQRLYALQNRLLQNKFQASMNKSKVIITGTISSSREMNFLTKIIGEDALIVDDQTTKTFKNLNRTTEMINQILRSNDLGHLKIRSIGKVIAMFGIPKNNQERGLALKIARHIHEKVEDHMESSQYSSEPTVIIDITFLEYGASDELTLSLLGLGASDTAQGIEIGELGIAGKSGNFGSRGLWSVAPLTTLLKLIKNKTHSRVVANPRLVVRSGTQGKFHNGHETYLVTKTAESTSLFPLEAGMMLKVFPKVGPFGTIDLKIDVEISEFTDDTTFEGRPGKAISLTQTAVTIQDGQSVLLTGFKSTKRGKSVTKIPGLGDIPIIGELFKARTFSDREIRTMILLTTRVVPSGHHHISSFKSFEKETQDRYFQDDLNKSEDDISFSFFD